MKTYDKKPSKGFIHFLINFGLIIFIFGTILYKSWFWLGLASIIYLLYIWNNMNSFIKSNIPGLFIRSKQILRFLYFLKNPLWIIVILLIVISFLLWNISQRIGHDFVFESEGTKETIKPTGLYRTIYGSKPEIPYYADEFEKIIDRLDWIDDKLGDIEWNTR